MMNWRLIDEAVKLVEEYFAFEHIAESTSSITSRAVDWYNNSEIVDSEMLAAAVIHGSYSRDYTWDDLEKIKEFYFPSIPIEMTNFGIGEIEASMKDAIWR